MSLLINKLDLLIAQIADEHIEDLYRAWTYYTETYFDKLGWLLFIKYVSATLFSPHYMSDLNKLP